MNSKLSRWCYYLIEAGWLAAIITIPLFFNVYSDRVFDAEKTSLLRSIALVMALAWLVQQVCDSAIGSQTRPHADSPTRRLADFISRPFVLPLLLLILVYLVATALSIAPAVSWAGSYRRLQGSYTLLAYATIMALTMVSMRTRPQVRRAVTAAILTSVPIALYAGLQRYNLDPIPWGGGWQVRVQLRVIGQMGHPIFVAAYLAMLFPLTAARIGENVLPAASSEPGHASHPIHQTLSILLYSLVAVLQLLAILWSGSRGPLLGLVAGMGLFVALLVVALRREGKVTGRSWRWLSGGGAVLGTLLAGWFILFNLPSATTAPYRQTPLLGSLLAAMDGWRQHPTLGRFGRLLETETSTGRVRVLIWQGTVDLIRPHQPLSFPDGQTDDLNFLRPFLGYGPDTLLLVYSPFYDPEIASLEARDTAIDRAHNETLDVLAMTGLAGFIAWQFLFLGLFYYGFSWLGLIRVGFESRAHFERGLLVGLWLGGGVVLAALILLWRGPAYLGVAFPAGNVAGLFLYLLYTARQAKGEPPAAGAPASQPDYLLLAGLLAAFVAHFVEIQFGIAIVGTRTLFFILAAILFVVGRRQTAAEIAARPETTTAVTTNRKDNRTPGRGSSRKSRKQKPPVGASKAARPGWLAPVLAAALVIALLVAVVGYEFVLFPQGFTIESGTALSSAATILRRSFFSNGPATSPFVFLLILAAWLTGTLISLTELAKSGVIAPVPPRPASRVAAALAALVGLIAAVPLGLAVGLWAGLSLAIVAAAALYRLWDSAWNNSLLPAGLLAGLSLILGLAYPYFQALQLYAGAFTSSEPAGLLDPQLAQALQSTHFLGFFYLFILGMMLLLALVLSDFSWSRREKDPAAGWVSLLLLLPLVLYLVYQTNLRPNQADVIYKQATVLDQQAFQARDPVRLDQAISFYEQAVAMAPQEALYRSLLGSAYLQKASITAEPAAQDHLWQEAQTHLSQAQRQLPLHPNFTVNLARLEATRARLDSGADQEALVATAGSHYQAALTLSPRNGVIWNEYADMVYRQGQECDRAIDLYQESARADPYYASTYVEMAGLHLACPAEGQTADTYRAAIAALRQGLARWAASPNPEAWERLAQQYTDLEEFEAALVASAEGWAATYERAGELLDQAQASLAVADLAQVESSLQEALELSRQLVTDSLPTTAD
ncbi:MAG: O-antigen ligase family protein [Chloroflexi bacterium]|nr:O-antigen ligase family protein [Chloroflexota bacterium]MCI0580347.1 O-antigen ligase family protein [Chloroflexota bacterium]MCI0648506.1 O-antigen ligase family protein [Chloroflexota bacterium]MCI0728514.1 O-antigen ligase family protein [Chloroflexota bacterium]